MVKRAGKYRSIGNRTHGDESVTKPQSNVGFMMQDLYEFLRPALARQRVESAIDEFGLGTIFEKS
jgi:hypothetical protein